MAAQTEESINVSDASFATQFAASVKKNFTLKRESKCTCFFETLLPIIFVFGSYLIWIAVGHEDYPAHNYYTPELTLVNISDIMMDQLCYNKTSLVIPGVKLCNVSDTSVDHVCSTPQHRFPPALTNGEICAVVEKSLSIVKTTPSPFRFSNFSNPHIVPTLDDMLMLNWYFILLDPERNEDGWLRSEEITQTAWWAMKYVGYLYVTPNNSDTRAFVNSLNTSSEYFKYIFGGYFANEDDAMTYLTDIDNEDRRHWGLLSFSSFTPTNFDVTIRLNKSALVWSDFVLDQVYTGGVTHGIPITYWTSGFLTLQRTIAEYYIEFVMGQVPPPSDPIITFMPNPEFTDWAFLKVGAEQGYFALFIVLSFLYPVSQISRSLVNEKETKIREAMLIMGLSTTSYYLSWAFIYFCEIVFSSFACGLIAWGTYMTRVNYWIQFFVYFFFGNSAVALAALFSSMFSKARVAATVVPVAYFVLAIPMFLVNNWPAALKSMFLLLSPAAMAQATSLMANHEIQGGMGAKELVSARDDPNMLAIIFMLFFDTILYWALAVYIDAVIPSEWGAKKHPCFCVIDPIKWCFGKKELIVDQDQKAESGYVFESQVGNPNAVTVKACNLLKKFERGSESFTAVDHLNLGLRENEINVLLGHNGAGKTTTMAMMIGLIEPDDGDTFIYDDSTADNLAAIRKSVGYCPQHDILWPELTCEEHLLYFAGLKGITGAAASSAVDHMLQAVDLGPKKLEKAGSLSGGQKRKLSVANAFVGGSRFVLLDEPTAGMDVGARRKTWDLIRSMTPNRTVLLTTHFMDEADLLGHNISILSKGRLVCRGSSMFLKSRLGVGYTLTVSMEDPEQGGEQVEALVKNVIPDAKHVQCGSEEVAFLLPSASAPKFPSIFGALEADKGSLNARDFGITMTTLEEVFLLIAKNEEMNISLEQLAMGAASPQSQGQSLQMAGMQQPPLGTSAVPVPNSTDASPASQEEDLSLVWVEGMNADNASEGPDLLGQWKSLMAKRFHNAKRDRRAQCYQILAPSLCILFALLLTKLNWIEDSDKMYLDAPMYKVSQVEFDVANCGFANQNIWPSHTKVTPLSTQNASATSKYLLQDYLAHGDIEKYVAIHCNDTSGDANPNFVSPAVSGGSTVVFGNASAMHAWGEGLHYFYSGYVHMNTGSASAPLMRTATHNMDWTARQVAFIEAIGSFFVGTFILIPMAFVPSVFISWVVKERENHAKHLQTVSGMNYYVYWISNLLFDELSFVLTITLAFLLFFIFNRVEYVGSGAAFFATFLLLMLYGLSGASSAYVVSFAFDEHATAQNAMMGGNFLAGFLLFFLSFMLRQFESTKTVGKVLAFLFRVFPAFCMGEGLVMLGIVDFLKEVGLDKSPFDLEWGVGWDLIYMAITFPLYFIITLVMDHPGRKRKQQMLLHNPDELPPQIDNEDVDVKKERMRIENSDARSPCLGSPPTLSGEMSPSLSPNRQPDLVVVKNLRKVWDGKNVAVKNLSFGVRQGEVFGFLGTNGAGKTTTISILCGEHLPTNGWAYILGHNVAEDPHAAQRFIGYCPQFDALLELLTPEEHLRLYAGLRGIPPQHIEAVVENLLHVCALKTYREVPAGELSGGNKRKLSVAIALIGAPKVVFLDEPSAGMDPFARHRLWGVIKEMSKKCSVVLTTHHLEEVEALAHRVAIMVQGGLHCIGDKTHLKTKFGSGFEMTVSLQDVQFADKLIDNVLSVLPQAQLQERHSLRFVFTFPQTVLLSELFQILESNRQQFGIADYAVTQTSLEQVFLKISTDAEHEDLAKADAMRQGADDHSISSSGSLERKVMRNYSSNPPLASSPSNQGTGLISPLESKEMNSILPISNRKDHQKYEEQFPISRVNPLEQALLEKKEERGSKSISSKNVNSLHVESILCPRYSIQQQTVPVFSSSTKAPIRTAQYPPTPQLLSPGGTDREMRLSTMSTERRRFYDEL